MKLRQLQHYLDLVKWRESERRGCDMCEKYARCRFCNRRTPNPCAVAYLKLQDAQKGGEKITLAAGQLPEPELPDKFDAESVARAVAPYEKPLKKSSVKIAGAAVRLSSAKSQSALTLKVAVSDGKPASDGTRLFVLDGEG